MTACSFAVSDHVCWNWAVRAARTAILLFILGRTLSTCRSLGMRHRGSIRRACWGFCARTRGVDIEAVVAARRKKLLDPTQRKNRVAWPPVLDLLIISTFPQALRHK